MFGLSVFHSNLKGGIWVGWNILNNFVKVKVDQGNWWLYDWNFHLVQIMIIWSQVYYQKWYFLQLFPKWADMEVNLLDNAYTKRDFDYLKSKLLDVARSSWGYLGLQKQTAAVLKPNFDLLAWCLWSASHGGWQFWGLGQIWGGHGAGSSLGGSDGQDQGKVEQLRHQDVWKKMLEDRRGFRGQGQLSLFKVFTRRLRSGNSA